MRKVLLIISSFIAYSSFYSQGGVGINNVGTAPNPNAMLDVSSDSKGVLITRLTTTERVTLGNGMGLTENGMLVYDKDLLAFFYWDGTQWVLVGNGTGSDDQNLTGATLTGTSLQIDIENGTSTTVNLAVLQDGVDDADNDPNNEIELPATATTGQVLSWNGTAWVAQNSASGADNWGNDVVNTTGTNISGDGTTVNPLTITEVDGDITNEIQDLTLNTTTNILTITNNGTATNIDLTPYLDNTDAQTLTLTGNTLAISNGNNVTLIDNVNDGDFDATNEIELPTGGTNGQVLSTNGSGTYTWINDNTGTDNQNIAGSSFNANTGDLVIGIQNGTSQTLNFNGLKDHDWYEVGGTTAPDAITDNIFTQGNVGIGTSTPSRDLVIGNNTIQFSSANNIGTTADILFRQSGLITSGTSMLFNIDAGNTSTLEFFSFNKDAEGTTGSTELIRIQENGNVGIGTANPSELLELFGGGIQLNQQNGISFRGELPSEANPTVDGAKIYFDTNTDLTLNPNNDFLIIEKTDGNDVTSPDGGITFALTAQNNIRNYAMTIIGNGNVGIGTTTPAVSSQLELASTTSGFLINRADTAAIASPVFALQTLSPIDSCLYMYSGSKWISQGGVGKKCLCNCYAQATPQPLEIRNGTAFNAFMSYAAMTPLPSADLANATDNDPTTFITTTENNFGYFAVDMGSSITLSSVVIVPSTSNGFGGSFVGHPGNLAVYGSNTGATWTQTSISISPTTGVNTKTFGLDGVPYRYFMVRLNVCNVCTNYLADIQFNP